DLGLVAGTDAEAISGLCAPDSLRHVEMACHPGHFPRFQERLHRRKVADIAVEGPVSGRKLREVVGTRDNAAVTMCLIIERHHPETGPDIAPAGAMRLVIP